MKRVIIESPYAGDIRGNTEYLKRCLRDSIDRGEAPLASHLLYPFVLREDLKDERQLGIELGFEWWYGARCIVFYIDKGWSSGMLTALERAKRFGKDIEFRRLNILDSRYLKVQMPETVKTQKGSWLKRWLRAIWNEPSARRNPETPAEISELAYGRAQRNDAAFINSTLSRDAPSPVPWGEANDLK